MKKVDCKHICPACMSGTCCSGNNALCVVHEKRGLAGAVEEALLKEELETVPLEADVFF